MTSTRERVIAARERVIAARQPDPRGFTGAYDASGHIEMARRLWTITAVTSRYQAPTRKLNDDQVAAIRKLYASNGVSKRELAVIFDVSDTTIHTIVNGKHYRDVEATDAG